MSKIIKPLLMVISVLLMVILQAGFIFLLLALLPSIVMYFIDGTPGKSLFKTVFGCNMAATLPWLLPMGSAGIQFKHYDISPILSDPYVWFIIYCAAGAGWCVLSLCRFAARIFVAGLYSYKVAALERAQKRLLEEWGEKIPHVE